MNTADMEEELAFRARNEAERRGIRHLVEPNRRGRKSTDKVGPSALEDLLAQLGLKLTTTRNTPENQGKSPELVMCQHFNVYVADPENRWRTVPRETGK